jgi:predicted AAA+ superfamily ATPase
VQIDELLGIYNPWWGSGLASLDTVKRFERPILARLIQDLTTQRQMLSVTGPRRVGKTTLLRQIVRSLLQQGRNPREIVYYSLDDPTLARPGIQTGPLIELLMAELRSRAGGEPIVVLLDEVQRLPNWELIPKKYYDLEYPFRIVISGSASSPIFKKSRESLLGRVKDYHILPFSFREFLMYRLQTYPELLEELDNIRAAGEELMGMLGDDPNRLDIKQVFLKEISPELQMQADHLFIQYLSEGGFPEVWELPSWDHKIEYLFDNQVKKVIYEDLVLAAEFRKPEELKRFYLSLLEGPGREVNIKSMASETGINVQQIEKYLPLLEMTNLLSHVPKFRASPVRVRKGNIKVYLVDLALRNAVLRLPADFANEPQIAGLYAENLVCNALRKWRGTLALDYFREGGAEVDFVVHTRPSRFLPVEVKYRDKIEPQDLRGLDSFSRRFPVSKPIVVSKNRADFGLRANYFFLPLIHFLLLFD